MPFLAEVLVDAWLQLPDEVRANRDVARAGLPTKTTREYLLPECVTLSRSRLTGRLESELDDAESAATIEQVGEHADLIARYAAWMTALRATAGTTSRIDQRALCARDLALAAPDPSALEEGEASRLLDEAVDDIVRRSRFSTTRLTAVVASALRPALEARLDDVWWRRERPAENGSVVWHIDREAAEQGPFTPDERRDLRRLGLPLAFIAFSAFDGSRPVSTPQSEWVWARMLEQPAPVLARTAHRLGLTLVEPGEEPVRPKLAGPAAEETDADRPSFPLDSSLHERLWRVAKDRTTDYPPDLDAAAAFELAVDAAGAPLGVPPGWTESMLLIGGAAAGLITWSHNPDADRRFRVGLSGGAATVAGRWRDEVQRVRSRGDLARGTRAVAFMQNPVAYLMGRLWTRVLRLCLLGTEPPSAMSVWANVYGAFTSTREQLAEVVTAQKRQGSDVSIEREVLAPGAARTVFRPPREAEVVRRSAVDDVLRTAIDVDGSARVLTFWQAVVDLDVRRVPDPSLVATWDGWVEAYRRAYPGVDGPFQPLVRFDCPFAHVWAVIRWRGAL